MAVSSLPSSSTIAAMKPLAISTLMSPPDLPPYESFEQSALASTPKPAEADKPLSPPVSPWIKSNASDRTCQIPAWTGASLETSRPGTGDCSPDPVLYPASEINNASPSQQPLFRPSHPAVETDIIIDRHLASRSPALFHNVLPPTREDYSLTVSFKSGMMAVYQKDPKGWLRRERLLLRQQRDARIAEEARAKRPVHRSIRPAATTIVSEKLHRRNLSSSATTRIAKAKPAVITPRFTAAQAVRPRAISSSTSIAVTATVLAPQPYSSSSISAMGEPPVKRSIKVTPKKSEVEGVEPRSKPANRADKDYESIPDYSPPLSSLDGQKPGCMKVEWRGQHMDLSRDPLAHVLHKEELVLAGCIRVDCATYLTAKRRIFQRRLECMMQPKEFRKTDAQQACHIDVNKASKMWQSFEKVGWLEPKWMVPHLPKTQQT